MNHGLANTDQRSDIYSLCKSLSILFCSSGAPAEVRALQKLESGLSEEPSKRCRLEDLSKLLSTDDDEAAAETSHVFRIPARYWSEGDEVSFNNRVFRIASKIGSGSFGSTFKVIEVHEGQDVGIFAGKVMFEAESGRRALNAYRRACSHTDKPHLATVFQLANDWDDDCFIALLQWVEGRTLHDWIGYTTLYAEELGETPAALVGRWIISCCEGLSALHRAGLVHGDVSPKNVIEHSGDVSLVDFDLLLPQGEPSWSAGTLLYTPDEQSVGQPADCSNDVYALATTIHHVVFDRQPFWYGGEKLRENGLDWSNIDRNQWQWIPEFLDKAVGARTDSRFANAMHALKWIKQQIAESNIEVAPVKCGSEVSPSYPLTASETQPPFETDSDGLVRTANHVDWLGELLSTYPGSPRGGIETRGLDSSFAHQTYVETTLEATLLDQIKSRSVQLVILCGNAGDGKTAFLQHLSVKLGIGKQNSSERVANGQAFGLSVKINLDGAASYKSKSADELLNELFAPFLLGRSSEPRVHLVAVNDGRLLQWAEEYESVHGETPLTEWIIETLIGDEVLADPMKHIRLVNLNERSLVGDARRLPVSDEEKVGWKPSTEFLNAILDRMLGGENWQNIWKPCSSCSAASRCTAFKSVQSLTGQHDDEKKLANNIRVQLAEALQAVHQRGQVHITTRELRGALSYIFFGIHHCDDLHAQPDLEPQHYWDRCFAADSEMRQGEVLTELQRLDPAYGSNPTVDRYLRSRDHISDATFPSRFANEKTLKSKRRRAYFEWLGSQALNVTAEPHPVPLFQSESLRQFREVAILSNVQKRELTKRLCLGISRLEQLPHRVLRRQGVVPLKVMPRTPVETTFWVEKPLERFQLDVDESGKNGGVEWLANGVILRYSYRRDGRFEELRLSSDLFGLLLELADGYQIMDTANDEIFTNLSIFTQRLAQEDEREVFAWNPGQPAEVFRLALREADGVQQMQFEALEQAQMISEETSHV